tara:strand:- start:5412 stop:5816 length:405 start_codon:yes stop_codon:yes gene_type:complete
MILKNLFTKGSLDSVNNLVDNLVTSKEERKELKIKFKQVLLDAESKAQEEITKRHTNDMMSDSWLSKNVRPMTLIFLIVCTVVLIFIDAGYIDFNVKESFVGLLEMTLVTIIGFYFGSRGIEKFKKPNNEKKKN